MMSFVALLGHSKMDLLNWAHTCHVMASPVWGPVPWQCSPLAGRCHLYLAGVLACAAQGMWVFLTQLWHIGGRSRASGATSQASSCVLFQAVRLDWHWEAGAFFPPLSFSFIVITKYIPMMENYGFLLATWQLRLYLFFSFWCIF